MQMTTADIFASFLINIVAGVLIFIVGYLWPIIPKSIRSFRLKKFFGPSVLSDHFGIVYGTLQDPRPRHNPDGTPTLRFNKLFRDGRVMHIAGPFENIVGDCEIRASTYLAQSIGKNQKQAIKALSDANAFDDLNYSFVALGSPSSNDLSRYIMQEPLNEFYRFNQDHLSFFIESIRDHQRFDGFIPPIRKDCAILMKIRNPNFPTNNFFLCAGLGEWGTSGASWYLSKYWENLYKEFNNDEFALILEVHLGCDSSARRIASLRKP